MSRATGAWVAAGLLLSIGVALSLLTVDFLPTNDGPQHIYSTYASAHIDDPALGYSRYLAAGSPITNFGFDVIYRPLLSLFEFRLAHQVALTVIALLWAWGVMALAAALGRPWLGLFGFGTALSWTLYMGFFAFQCAGGVGLGVLAYALRANSPRPRDRFVVGAGLLVVAFFHIFPAVLAGVTLLAVNLLRVEPGRRLGELAATALTGAPAAGLALLTSSGHVVIVEQVAVASLLERLANLGRAFASGPPWRAFFPVALAAAAVIAVLSLALSRRRPLPPSERGLLLSGLLGTVAAVAAPLHLRAWEFFDVRFIPYGITFLVLLLPTERISSGAPARAAAALLTLWVSAAIAWAAAHNHAFRREHDEVLSGLDRLPHRPGARLDLPARLAPSTERAIPYVNSTLHFGLLYAAAQGGTPTRPFVSAPTMHFLRPAERPTGRIVAVPEKRLLNNLQLPPEQAPPGGRAAALTDALSASPGYDDVLLYGYPEDMALLEARRFRFDVRAGGLAIGQFQWCPLTVHVPDSRAALVIDGAWRAGGPIRTERTLPPAPARDVLLHEIPCGEYFLRVTPDPGTACGGAGFVRLALTGPTRIDCSAH